MAIRHICTILVIIRRGDTSEVGPLLLLLEVGNFGVGLGPLGLLLEPTLLCGVASAFAIGTIQIFWVCGIGIFRIIFGRCARLVLISFTFTRRVAAVGSVVRIQLVVLAPQFCPLRAVGGHALSIIILHVESCIEVTVQYI